MSPSAPTTPDPISVHLAAAGLTRLAATALGSFGSQVETWYSGDGEHDLTARVVRDRDARWVDVCVGDEGFDVALWARLLGAPDASALDADPEAQAAWLAGHREAVQRELAASDRRGLLARLQAAGEARTRARLGW